MKLIITDIDEFKVPEVGDFKLIFANGLKVKDLDTRP